MVKMDEITECVKEKALKYLKETDDEIVIETFPESIVDYVIEYVVEQCHFPSHYKEKQIVSILERGKNTLAMACVDIFSKAGGEGETAHTENGIGRQYKSEWISFDLLSNFPNFVKVY